MQLTRETVTLYEQQAPELRKAVVAGEAEFVMRRDADSDYCVKFDQGLCAIHRDYGATFLGDACHFYPRITRALDDSVLTSLALSCPEAARLSLYGEQGLALAPREELRVPFSLRNYLPASVTPAQAVALHERFVTEAGNPTHSAAQNAMRLYSAAQSFVLQPPTQWADAAAFFFSMAAGRLPAAEAKPTDLIHLAHALEGLLRATASAHRPALIALSASIFDALGMVGDAAGGVTLAPDCMQRGVQLLQSWNQHGAQAMAPVLARYLQAQVSQSMLPWAGLGPDLPTRVLTIAVRFALLRLALMVETQRTQRAPTPEAVVTITYQLSRFLDHLADATLLLSVCEETGWNRTSRLRALLGDE